MATSCSKGVFSSKTSCSQRDIGSQGNQSSSVDELQPGSLLFVDELHLGFLVIFYRRAAASESNHIPLMSCSQGVLCSEATSSQGVLRSERTCSKGVFSLETTFTKGVYSLETTCSKGDFSSETTCSQRVFLSETSCS